MRSDVEGSAATSAAPVSRFAGTLMEILDRVEYSRVRMDVTDNPIAQPRRAPAPAITVSGMDRSN